MGVPEASSAEICLRARFGGCGLSRGVNLYTNYAAIWVVVQVFSAMKIRIFYIGPHQNPSLLLFSPETETT